MLNTTAESLQISDAIKLAQQSPDVIFTGCFLAILLLVAYQLTIRMINRNSGEEILRDFQIYQGISEIADKSDQKEAAVVQELKKYLFNRVKKRSRPRERFSALFNYLPVSLTVTTATIVVFPFWFAFAKNGIAIEPEAETVTFALFYLFTILYTLYCGGVADGASALMRKVLSKGDGQLKKTLVSFGIVAAVASAIVAPIVVFLLV